MPQSSYLQTIARRGKSPLPVLMPPRSPLSRIESPLTAEVAHESIPVQPPSEPANRVVVSPQQQPSIQIKQVRSPVDSATTAPARLPSSIEVPQEIQATSVLSQTSSVSPAVENSQQKTSLTVQPTTPVTHSLPAPEDLAQLPNRSGQSSNFAPVTTVPKPRSYLAKAATSLMLKTSPKVSKAASPEGSESVVIHSKVSKEASPEVSESVVIHSKVSKAASPEIASSEVSESVVIHSKVSKAASPEIASPEVSESVVILQVPQNDSARQKFDRPPQSTATAQSNTVHIGTIDIHIAPPPTPPIQPVATAPKPVALSPLARGFTSSFGLRQG
jgi:hypothetical protein